jgi:hypothetical protein
MRVLAFHWLRVLVHGSPHVLLETVDLETRDGTKPGRRLLFAFLKGETNELNVNLES